MGTKHAILKNYKCRKINKICFSKLSVFDIQARESKEASTQTDESTNAISKTIAEEIKEAAENVMQNQGMVYEESSGLYYDYNSGYYYNAVSILK